MSDGQALYNAIVANPDDDTPRLIYADWIAGDSGWDNAEEKAVWLREQVQTNGASGFWGLPSNSYISKFTPEDSEHNFRRGFIDTIRVGFLKRVIGRDGTPTKEAIEVARRFPIRKWEFSYSAIYGLRYSGDNSDIGSLHRSDRLAGSGYTYGASIGVYRLVRDERLTLYAPICHKLCDLLSNNPMINGVSLTQYPSGEIVTQVDCVRSRVASFDGTERDWDKPPLLDIFGECVAKWVHMYAFPEDVK